ncbi:hypothetical protein U8607_23925 [Methylobacterium durans]|uniref:hypothetical protein n=1 Tax=Methylobacterium durans TaxID=2202825 RepID=UPI002AFE60DB|nr:hypothetical protein [Methylobacterium durans]MEA1835139.1 hypothetical protein [Methylobacterium durans]
MRAPEPEPSVGIFWGLRDGGGAWELVHAATPLAQAEPYGDCLTYPGAHYEVWEGWRRLRPAGLRARGLPAMIAAYEYEHFPRGRVVYMRTEDCFTIFADRRLQRPEMIGWIVQLFGLAERCHVVRSDAHYRSLS